MQMQEKVIEENKTDKQNQEYSQLSDMDGVIVIPDYLFEVSCLTIWGISDRINQIISGLKIPTGSGKSTMWIVSRVDDSLTRSR